MDVRYARLGTPLGPIRVWSQDQRLGGVDLEDRPIDGAVLAPTDRLLAEALSQLGAYFAGRLARFDLPLAPAGTAFERSVWDALTRIPFGATTSYGAIAAEIGRPQAARAVGRANGRNPWAIVVPCHRVIGSMGALTGYAGGLFRKRWLLDHEVRVAFGLRDRDIRVMEPASVTPFG
jgi:methylated-DNA-[protein]-cysteine S-methyltransferase